jgi:hypothetical protein
VGQTPNQAFLAEERFPLGHVSAADAFIEQGSTSSLFRERASAVL